MTTHSAQLVHDARAEHGEGPVWNPFTHELLWVDLTGCKIHVHNPATQSNTRHIFKEPVCAIAPRSANEWLVAFAKRLATVHIPSLKSETICLVEPLRTNTRCNDGKCDPAGRFWIGTMANDGAAGAGNLYRLDGNTLTCVLPNVGVSNGMDWTPDGRTMFYIDTLEREVWAFDFDPVSSSISNRRVVVKVSEDLGYPDGMCLGPDGNLWVAHWGAGCVCEWDPRTGKLLRRVETGCPHTSSCCLIGGRLFITTSRQGLNESALAKAPHSGSLFSYSLWDS
jgi:sugar lactone lactonase YvrE